MLRQVAHQLPLHVALKVVKPSVRKLHVFVMMVRSLSRPAGLENDPVHGVECEPASSTR